MSVQLLDKTRKINKLLHNNNSHKVVFNDICKVLSEILLSNILVISKKGKVLGVSIWPGVDEIEELIEDQVGGYVDKQKITEHADFPGMAEFSYTYCLDDSEKLIRNHEFSQIRKPFRR